MNPIRHYRLNPCDYLFYAHHKMMGHAGVEGNRPYMIMDLQGVVAADRLMAAVESTGKAYAVINSRSRVARLSGKPYWHTVSEPSTSAVTTHDWRQHSDGATRVVEWCERQLADPWNFEQAPQIRLDLFLAAEDRSHLCLRWPHALMDAEGAQWLLSEVNRLGLSPASVAPAQVRADGCALDPLAGVSLRGRFGLFWKGFKSYRSYGSIPIDQLADGPAVPGHWRIEHRRWKGDQWRELRAIAERWCPEGPARFSRYLGGCVLRALHRLFTERGIDAPAYLVTQPMRVRGIPVERPIHGNYLVSATLAAVREVVVDKRRLMDDLSRQLDAFLSQRNDAANWALVWLASLFREWQYRWYLSRPRGLQPYASGFSYYGEIDPPIRSFLGTTVSNFYGGGTLAAPPGWNPVFSRFGDSLNLALTWREGYFSRETASRYVELIEREMWDQ